jgi:diguanylate cyclase (GGDEF)-like protein
MRALGKHAWQIVLALMLALDFAAPAAAAIPVETCVAPLERAAAVSLPFDCTGKQTRFGSGDFGVQLRFAPVRSEIADPLVLRTSSVWEGRRRVVFHYADGTTAARGYGSGDAARFMSVGAILEIQVPARAAPLDGVYIEIADSANWRGVLLGAHLMLRSESEHLKAWLIALYAGFGGLSLALLAYNYALWRALRHRFQLTYCTMVASLAGYTFTASGAVLLALPWLDNNDRLRINYVLLALSAVAGVRFIADFFGSKVVSPRLDRMTNWVCGFCLAVAIAFALLAPHFGMILDKAYFAGGGGLLAMVFPMIWAAWRARVRHFGLFLLAWSAPILVSLARSAHGLGLIGYSFWLDNGNMIALSLESLLSTMLIVARLRDLSSERDQARAGEISALRLANSDHLTGLLNRRAFLAHAIGRSEPHRLLLIDIDRFKAINDRLGHDAGDDVLRAIAAVLQALRPADSLAVRLGGEEFALLVPVARQGDCLPEDILAAVRAKAMPLDWKVTVSLGFADGRVHTEEDWKRLYRLADTALYRAKADGRDRACRATDFAMAATPARA